MRSKRVPNDILALIREEQPRGPDPLATSLGSGHPLVIIHRSISSATSHVRTCVLILAIAGTLVTVNPEYAYATGAAAILVGCATGGWIAVARRVRRDRIDDLILAGTVPSAPIVRSEIHRLCDPRNRASLAATLERALDAGERWSDLLPASRPPPGVRNLPQNADLIRMISAALRDQPMPPRPVVMVERLVRGGYGAVVYGAEPDWLRRELVRIWFEVRRKAGDGTRADAWSADDCALGGAAGIRRQVPPRMCD